MHKLDLIMQLKQITQTKLEDDGYNVDDFVLLSDKEFDQHKTKFNVKTIEMLATITTKLDKKIISKKIAKYIPMSYEYLYGLNSKHIEQVKLINEFIDNKETMLLWFKNKMDHKFVHFPIEFTDFDEYGIDRDSILNVGFNFIETIVVPSKIIEVNCECESMKKIHIYCIPKQYQISSSNL